MSIILSHAHRPIRDHCPRSVRLCISGEKIEDHGPVETKTIADVQVEPYPLPAGFEWFTVDMTDEAQVDDVYNLLVQNYVEDSDAMFRFDYSREFLKWYFFFVSVFLIPATASALKQTMNTVCCSHSGPSWCRVSTRTFTLPCAASPTRSCLVSLPVCPPRCVSMTSTCRSVLDFAHLYRRKRDSN
jgi:hypothetical protein